MGFLIFPINKRNCTGINVLVEILHSWYNEFMKGKINMSCNSGQTNKAKKRTKSAGGNCVDSGDEFKNKTKIEQLDVDLKTAIDTYDQIFNMGFRVYNETKLKDAFTTMNNIMGNLNRMPMDVREHYWRKTFPIVHVIRRMTTNLAEQRSLSDASVGNLILAETTEMNKTFDGLFRFEQEHRFGLGINIHDDETFYDNFPELVRK